MKKQIIGFIGQGWIGKNYADDFEDRGYKVVRYDLEKYKMNKSKIKTCDIVFIAIPTPSTIKKGQDYVDVDINETLFKVVRDDTKDGQIIVTQLLKSLNAKELNRAGQIIKVYKTTSAGNPSLGLRRRRLCEHWLYTSFKTKELSPKDWVLFSRREAESILT